jgi:hypothetical protein
MKKTFIMSAVVVALFSYGFATGPSVAEAACSVNGYMNSGGKCGGSFKQFEKKPEKFEKKYSNYDSLNAYIQHLLLLLAQYDRNNDNDDDDDSDTDEAEVRTLSATNIDEDGATLRAIIDMNDDDEAEFYFEYGTSAGNLGTKTTIRDLDDTDDGDTQSETITGLNDDTRYYFRAVVKDEDGDKDYGITYSFMTEDDSSTNDDEDPVVTTMSATNTDSDSSELRGSVDMNDFENGTAFFVFGENENQVGDVEDDFDSYTDVDEDNDDLRKVLTDSDVDGSESYTKEVTGLDDNTDIFFTLCVEYEDEDDDETLECGAVRTFETN